MTDEEKKEFEEFLQWKKEKEQREKEAANNNNPEQKDELDKESTDSNLPEQQNQKTDNQVAQPNSSEKYKYLQQDKQTGGNNTSFVIVIVAIFVFLILCFLILKSCSTTPNNQVSTLDSAMTDSAAVDSTAVVDGSDESVSGWDYKTNNDEMRNSKEYSATLVSDFNDGAGDFGGGTMTIYVRKAKRFGGLDVFLYLSSDQFGGSEFDGNNYVTVKFDDGVIRKYYFTEGEGSGTDLAFINKKSDFLARLKTAKSIKIEAQLFSSGTKQFNFQTTKPLEWNH